MDPSEKSPAFEDSAAFWLGKVVAIAELERSNGLTKHAALDAIQNTLKRMRENQMLVRRLPSEKGAA